MNGGFSLLTGLQNLKSHSLASPRFFLLLVFYVKFWFMALLSTLNFGRCVFCTMFNFIPCVGENTSWGSSLCWTQSFELMWHREKGENLLCGGGSAGVLACVHSSTWPQGPWAALGAAQDRESGSSRPDPFMLLSSLLVLGWEACI